MTKTAARKLLAHMPGRGLVRPAVVPSIAGLSSIVILGLYVLLSIAGWADHWSQSHPIASTLLQNAGLALAIALGGYFFVVGWHGLRIVSRYLKELQRDPVLVARDVLRLSQPTRRLVQPTIGDLAAEVVERRTADPILLTGPNGSGRTEILFGLVNELARGGCLVVPISSRGDVALDFVESAKETFAASVDTYARSTEHIEAIWRNLTRRNRLTIVVDDLDVALAGLDSEQQRTVLDRALSDARRASALVVASLGDDISLTNVSATRWDVDVPPVEDCVEMLEALGAPRPGASLVECLGKTPYLRRPIVLWMISKLPVEDVLRMAAEPPDSAIAELVALHVAQQTLDKHIVGHTEDHEPLDAAHVLSLLAAGSRGRPSFTLDEAITQLLEEGIETADQTAAAAVRIAAAEGLVTRVTAERVRFESSLVANYLIALALNALPALAESILLSLRRVVDIEPLLMAGAIDATVRESLAERCIGYAKAHDDASGLLALTASLHLAALRPTPLASDASKGLLAERGPTSAWLERAPQEVLIDWSAAMAAMSDASASRLLWTLSLNRSFRVRYDAARWLAKTADRRVGHLDTMFERELVAVEGAMQTGSPIPRDLPIGVVAWLLPTLESPDLTIARSRLNRVEILAETVDPLLLEQSLSRGFKIWAIYGEPRVDDDRCLAWMDRGLRFWHARLNLAHALAIAASRVEQRRPLTIAALMHLAQQDQHPFVREGSRIAADGLRNGEPWWQWSWEAETDVVATGGRRLRSDTQRLFGDIALMLNLTFSADADSTWRRQRRVEYQEWTESPRLPHCLALSRDRSEFWTGCPTSCEFKLCPYPSPSAPGLRVRLEEPFCRTIRRAVIEGQSEPWQRLPRRRLGEVWRHLEQQQRVG